MNLFIQKGFIHVLLLLLVLAGIVAGVYLVQEGPKIFTPKASQDKTLKLAADLTSQLLNENQELQKMSKSGASVRQSKINQMVDTTQRRKDQLLKLLESNPSDFLKVANLYDKRNQFPKEVLNHLEERIEKEGNLTVLHYDDFDNRKSSEDYYVGNLYNKNDRVKVYFTNPQLELKSNSQVKVEGVGLDDNVVVDDVSSFKVYSSGSVVTTGDKKLAVVLIKFQNDTADPFTSNEVNNTIFTSSTSVESFYNEASHGQLNLTGDVYGWYTVPFIVDETTNCIPDLFEWTADATNQANSQGANLDSYDFVTYVLSKQVKSCGWSGQAQFAGRVSYILGVNNSFIYSHELGHNLGLDHADSYYCPRETLDHEVNCSFTDYGDSFDVMGTDYYLFNAEHRVDLGWIQSPQLQTISSNGQYVLYSLESSHSPVVLKISRGIPYRDLYISLREKYGTFDSGLSDLAVYGISLHIDGIGAHSWFLDSTPQTENYFKDAFMTDSQVVTLPTLGITLKQLSHDSNSANVEITLTTPATPLPKPEDSIQPTPTITPTFSPQPTPSNTPSPNPSGSPKPTPNTFSCSTDADCVCGISTVDNQCAYGNKTYVDTRKQCPDFCTGKAGNLVIKCIANKCTQVSR